ncbi:MAG: response regulator [Spirosomataceae bacterium]
MLPQRDGYALAQDIRQLDAQIPILFLTAKTQTTDVIKGFEVGGNDYIRKTFSMEELIVRVQNLPAHTSQSQ